MRALRTIAAITVLLTLAPRDARAQPQDDAGRAAIERAREHMEQGQTLYLQGRFEEAAAEFEAAHREQPFAAFLYNAGVALERAGQPARAASMFERYVESGAAESDAAVRERITRLRAATAPPPPPAAGEGASPPPEPAPSPPPEPSPALLSLLSVRTNPAGATIVVHHDGVEVARGASPFSGGLEAGRYRVVVEHPDFQTVEHEVAVEAGNVYVMIVEMSQGEFLGYLRVVSDVPGAQVFVDEREAGARGQTPFEGPVRVGTHTVWIERPGYESVEREVEVGVGAEAQVEVELARVSNGRLRVVANLEGARVIVDDVLLGTVPFEEDVSAGPHRLRVESDGMKAFETPLTISEGRLTPVRARLLPDVGRGGAYVTTVFAAIFLGAGITLAVLGNDLDATLHLERDAGRLATDDPRLDNGLIYWIAADSAFGLGFVFGCLALYYFFYDPLPPSEGTVLEERDWAFAPLADPTRGLAGLAFEGSF